MALSSLRQLGIASAIAALLVSGTGCGILLGNVKPVEEKSSGYRVLDLAEGSADWQKLKSEELEPTASTDETARATEASDLAFQSKTTASIISLNSACRPGGAEGSLQEISRLLFLGISDSTDKSEREVQVAGQPALESTVTGKLNGEPMKLRAVVLKQGACVYDLMYVARPEKFELQESDFKRFVSSLRLGQ